MTLLFSIVLGGLPATASTLCANLTTSGSSGVCNGAFLEQIKARPTGSGVIDPFVRISTNQGFEEGYNTDARPYASNNNAQTTATFDHSEAENSVGITTGGTLLDNGMTLPGSHSQLYMWFMLDINQQKQNPLLSLDQLVVNFANTNTDNPAISENGSGEPTAPAQAGTTIYNMDAGLDRWAALNYSLNTGSGSGDVFAFIPVTLAQIGTCAAGCDVTVYSAFGLQGNYSGSGATLPGVIQAPAGSYLNNDGYEEWSAVRGQVGAAPEPSSMILMGAGILLGSVSLIRRRKK